MEFPATRFSRAVDPWLERIGQWASWLWVALLAVIVTNVVLRYVFGEGRIEFEEVQWHLYATGFLLGLGYALKADAHIRVDVLHERFFADLDGLGGVVRHPPAAVAVHRRGADLLGALCAHELRLWGDFLFSWRVALPLGHQGDAAVGLRTAAAGGPVTFVAGLGLAVPRRCRCGRGALRAS